MHIFCSVQRDLYFLFNVKLMTTHSKDVAASSVGSKNKLSICLGVSSKNTENPFAKTFLQKIQGIIFRSSGYGPSRAFRCWPLNFFFVIDKSKNDIICRVIFSLSVDGVNVVLIINIALISAVLIFMAVAVLQ